MKEEILIAGFGGQGVLLMGQILAEAAMKAGCHATWFPSYGPEMRGGTANCTTIFSDEEIGSPIAAEYDGVIAMNQPSVERFGPKVRAGGHLVVNESMVPIRYQREGIHVVYVPAADLARELGSERVVNIVMLGGLLGLRQALPDEAIEAAIAAVIGKKRPELIEINCAAVRLGRKAAEEQLSAV